MKLDFRQRVEKAEKAAKEGVERKFFAYQQRGFDQIKDQDRVALYWQMRLGKTLLAIRWLKYKEQLLNRKLKVLVVCPLSVIKTWQRELLLEGIKPLIISRHIRNACELLADRNYFQDGWFITNYEALRSLEIFERDTQQDWDCVILDEVTKIRKPANETKVSKQATTLFPNVPYKMVLSGFPAPESLADYFNQFKFLHGEFMGHEKFDTWTFRYTSGKQGSRYLFTPNLRQQVLTEVKAKANFLVRSAVNVGSKKLYTTREVEFPSDKRKVYDRFEALWFHNNQDGTRYETNWAMVAQKMLHQMAGGYVRHPDLDFTSNHKVLELVDLLQEELHEESVIIWANHRKEIDAIVAQLRKDFGPSSVDFINGEVTADARERVRLNFQAKKFPYVVCQSKTAMMGLDFSVADTAIFYSNSLECEVRYQCEDRFIHPQKHVPLLCIDLVTKNSIDEDIKFALDEKPKRNDLYQEKIYTNFIKRMAREAGIDLSKYLDKAK